MNISINIKTLKIISIISFLLISGIQEHGIPNIGLLTLYLFQAIHDIISNNSFRIFWEGLLTVPIIGIWIIFFKNRNYKILLFYFLCLLISLIYSTGAFYTFNYHRIDFWYILLFLIFIVSSLAVIYLTQKEIKQ